MPIPIPDALDENAALAADKAESRSRPAALPAGVGARRRLRRHRRRAARVAVSAPLVAVGLGRRQARAGRRVRHRPHPRRVRRRRAVHRQRDGDAAGLVAAHRDAGRGRRRAGRPPWSATSSGRSGLAARVHAGGTLTGPGAELVAPIAAAKDARDRAPAVLAGRAVQRARLPGALDGRPHPSDAAKLAVLWWALLAFIGSRLRALDRQRHHLQPRRRSRGRSAGAPRPQPAVDRARQRRRRRPRRRPRLRLDGPSPRPPSRRRS